MTRIGLIGGSGLDHWGEPIEEIPAPTAYGNPSAALALFEFGGHEILFLPRHGSQHDIAPHQVNYRANLSALHAQGATVVLTVNAVGSMNRSMPPGSLALPDQLIDYTWGREHSYCDADTDGRAGALGHSEFAHPFDHKWRQRLGQAAADVGIPVADRGCIGVTQGPRLETAAEIQRLIRDGCDLVGMTSMPEAALARELDLPYATLAVVANYAAGLEQRPISHEQIQEVLADTMAQARQLLNQLMECL